MELALLPLDFDLETHAILKKLAEAHRALAELKGVTGIVPNQAILIDTLSLQEAKDSSSIENIITTEDDLFRSDPVVEQFSTPAAKEVYRYAAALREGYQQVKSSGLLTNTHILAMQAMIEENHAGFRKLPGTSLKNAQTGETVYTPPQNGKEVRELMHNLESFINNDEMSEEDILTKMAIIHFQFESIHPFYDGNGRTGRILNILYLVKNGLLDTPVLYLSRFINQNKAEYYARLQAVRDEEAWEEWILYMLDAIIATSQQTVALIKGIYELMMRFKHKMREGLPNIYSQELLNLLFRHPYTKIDFLVKELGVHRNTASKYLDELVELKLLRKEKLKKDNYYINVALYDFLSKGP